MFRQYRTGSSMHVEWSRERYARDNLEELEREGATAEFDGLRAHVARVITSTWFEPGIGVIILAQLVVAGAETDAGARGDAIPTWITALNFSFLSIYILETIMRIYVWRGLLLRTAVDVSDIVIVTVDVIATLAESLIGNQVPSIAILRVLRLSKLVRALRAIKNLRELYLIIYGLAGAFRSMFWGTVLLCLIFTISSIIAVEIIHPLNLELAEDGIYEMEGCDRCERAFQSVLHSNLTFFQTMIAGDSWGQVIIPIIERYPWTSIFFVTVTVLIHLGFLNLVLTAIVDKAAEVREAHDAMIREEKLKELKIHREQLVSLCREVDIDNNGEVSLGALLAGSKHLEFAKVLAEMGVDGKDVEFMFSVMNGDHAGTVPYQLLVENLYRLKTEDDHSLNVLIKHSVENCRRTLANDIELFRDSAASQTRENQLLLERIAQSIDVCREQMSFCLGGTFVGHSAPPTKPEGLEVAHIASLDSRFTETDCSPTGTQDAARVTPFSSERIGDPIADTAGSYARCNGTTNGGCPPVGDADPLYDFKLFSQIDTHELLATLCCSLNTRFNLNLHVPIGTAESLLEPPLNIRL